MTAPRLIHLCRDEWGTIEVLEDDDERALHFGSAPRQSAMDRHDPAHLLLGYTRVMMAALLFVEAPASALMIGLGGGSLARFLHRHHPACRIDAVECRPLVAEVARSHFQLPPPPHLEIHIGRGEQFVAESEQSYDLLLVDAYDALGMDHHVAREGFLDHCRQRLTAQGVVAINLWRGEKVLVRDTLANLESVFGRPPLQLHMDDKGNMVAFALASPRPWRDLKGLKKRALALEERMRIGLPRLEKQLRYGNPVKLARTTW